MPMLTAQKGPFEGITKTEDTQTPSRRRKRHGAGQKEKNEGGLSHLSGKQTGKFLFVGWFIDWLVGIWEGKIKQRKPGIPSL